MLQRDIACKLGIGESYLSNILSGRFSAGKKLAAAMALLLGTDPGLWLYGVGNDRKIAIIEFQLRKRLAAVRCKDRAVAQQAIRELSKKK